MEVAASPEVKSEIDDLFDEFDREVGSKKERKKAQHQGLSPQSPHCKTANSKTEPVLLDDDGEKAKARTRRKDQLASHSPSPLSKQDGDDDDGAEDSSKAKPRSTHIDDRQQAGPSRHTDQV